MRRLCVGLWRAALLLPMLWSAGADAAIVRIEITERESPTFGGYAFPGVGP